VWKMKLETRWYAGASVDRTNLVTALIHIVSGPTCLCKVDLRRSGFSSKPAIEMQL
jgi:hypothetical protein